MVISHDSQLLSVVCDDEERSEVWLVEDGKVETYDGYFQVQIVRITPMFLTIAKYQAQGNALCCFALLPTSAILQRDVAFYGTVVVYRLVKSKNNARSPARHKLSTHRCPYGLLNKINQLFIVAVRMTT